MADRTYVITNRIRKGNTYGEDPELRGGIHFLVAPGRYTKNPRKFKEVRLNQFRAQLLAALGQKGVATMSGQDRATIPNRAEIQGSNRKGYVLG